MEIDVAGILCYTKNEIDAFFQTVRKGFTVWGNEKKGDFYEKNEKDTVFFDGIDTFCGSSWFYSGSGTDKCDGLSAGMGRNG